MIIDNKLLSNQSESPDNATFVYICTQHRMINEMFILHAIPTAYPEMPLAKSKVTWSPEKERSTSV